MMPAIGPLAVIVACVGIGPGVGVGIPPDAEVVSDVAVSDVAHDPDPVACA